MSYPRITLGPFPYPQFVAALQQSNFSPVLKLLHVLEQRRLLVIKEYFITFPAFFALEFYVLLSHLGKTHKEFLQWAQYLRERTWVRKLLGPAVPKPIDLSVLAQRKIELRPHQHRFLMRYSTYVNHFNLRGSVLAYEQGLGKTITALALMLALHKEKVLIVCPKTLIELVWKKELVEKLKEPERSIQVVTDTLDEGKRWYIVNYERLSRIKNSPVLEKIDGLIVDEAHFVRHLEAARTRTLVDLAREHTNITDILLLSGTPIKKDPIEWVPYLLILDPNIDGPLARTFISIFMSNPDLMRHIAAVRMRMIVVRELKAGNLPLPPKHLIDLEVSIPDVHRYLWKNIQPMVEAYVQRLGTELYAKYLSGWSQVRDALSEMAVDIEELNLFIKIALKSNPTYNELQWYYLVEQEWLEMLKDPTLREHLRNVRKLGKSFASHVYMKTLGTIITQLSTQCTRSIVLHNWEKICTIIQQAKKKTLIIGTIVPVLEYVHSTLPIMCKVQSVLITGEVADRESVVKEFVTKPEIKVLVGSIQTMGVGLTLVNANTMIVLNYPWRYSDLEQAMDRVHRIGQDTPVYVYLIRLRTKEINVHDHMARIAEIAREQVQEQLGILISRA
jgi:SNF2 family DNA or RNA helicase